MELTKQNWVDILFESVLSTTDDKVFCNKSRGERMAWVANMLRMADIDTHPIGSSWGRIVSKEERDEMFPNVYTINLETGKEE